MRKFHIKARRSGKVVFECELPAELEGASYGDKRGYAVKQALASGSDLSGSDLSGCALSGSDLSDSDLSDSDLSGCALSGSNLRGCDLSGSDLSGSDLSGSDLSGSDLRGSNLRGSDLCGSNLRDSDLSGSNLRGCDLSGSDLSDSDLRGSNLSGSNLSDSNLRGCALSGCDLSGVPAIKNIHQAVYTAAKEPKALAMSAWHSCATTHCRAGWVTRLAGEAGAAMEFCLGTPAAAALIYLKSDPSIGKIPNFYTTNEIALEDMRLLAEKEANAYTYLNADNTDIGVTIAALEAQGWVSVDERLPGIGVEVLTISKTYPEDGYTIESLVDGDISTDSVDWSTTYAPTHWQPLPQPPEAEE